MKTISLSDLNIYAIGNEIALAGMIYADATTVYLCPLAAVGELEGEIVQLKMGPEDWQRFLRQTDVQEVEVVTPEGKAILRKSQRMIDAAVTWAVYRRDGFRCRYCSDDSSPLTIDHAILWHLGGPTTLDNALSSCRKCNKKRGNKTYLGWLQSDYYIRVSENLTPEQLAANVNLLNILPSIPLVKNIRSR